MILGWMKYSSLRWTRQGAAHAERSAVREGSSGSRPAAPGIRAERKVRLRRKRDGPEHHSVLVGRGALTAIQTISDIPHEVPGNSGAEITVHPSGKFVYSSNRGHDSLAVFSVNAKD